MVEVSRSWRRITRLSAVAVAASLLCLSGVARPSDGGPERHRADFAPVIGPVRFLHDAELRFRPELLVGGDLGPGASPILSALEATQGDGDDLLAWASMRLRYGGTIEVGSPWAIHFSLDVLDNFLLGTTHVNAGGDFDEGLWRDAQGAPVGGLNSWQDAFRVRYVYGSWRVVEWLDLEGGRMPDTFGLGLLRHSGACLDCDFGTYVDGARLGFTFSDFRIEASWEATATGATTDLPGWPGQPKDLGDPDDVQSFTVRVGRDAFVIADEDEADGGLDVPLGWVLDWEIFSSFTEQRLSSSEIDLNELPTDCQITAQTASGQVALPWECWRLYPRDAFFWRPGLWFKAQWRPDALHSLRMEVEASGMIGGVDHLQRLEDLGDTGKDFRGFGGALEVEYEMPGWRFGLDFGFATGDDGQHLGVLDGQNIVEPDDGLYEDNANVRDNEVVTSFWFHRDYRLDLILFRQVIGAVTNAVYFKPWVGATLLDTGELALTARLDLLYAAAAKPGGTPGGGAHYGVELDADISLHMPLGFGLSLTSGLLIPLDALSDAETGASAEAAFAVRGLMSWRY